MATMDKHVRVIFEFVAKKIDQLDKVKKKTTEIADAIKASGKKQNKAEKEFAKYTNTINQNRKKLLDLYILIKSPEGKSPIF